MDINTLRQRMAERDSFSILETVDVHTGNRTILKEFDYVIEAPNWTQDGKSLVYNSRGHLHSYTLATGETGVPHAHVALAWLLQQEPVVAPVIGATKISHLESAVEALSVKLTPEEVTYLEEPYVPHAIVGHGQARKMRKNVN